MSTSTFPKNRNDYLTFLQEKYDWKYYKTYPEFCMKKLRFAPETFSNDTKDMEYIVLKNFIEKQYLINIDNDSLCKLPPIGIRNRTDVTLWFKETSISYDDFIGVGI